MCIQPTLEPKKKKPGVKQQLPLSISLQMKEVREMAALSSEKKKKKMVELSSSEWKRKGGSAAGQLARTARGGCVKWKEKRSKVLTSLFIRI